MDYEDLISRFAKKDAGALEEIYDNYGASLYGVIKRMAHDQKLAEDILQEVFIKIWKNAGSFDPHKGRLYTWMHRIAVTTTINYTQRKSTRVMKNIESDDITHSREIQNTNIDVIDLKGKVQGLAKDQMDVIDLIYFQGYTQQEASDHLAIPLGTVKTRCRAALKALRKIYLISLPVSMGLELLLIVLLLITG